MRQETSYTSCRDCFAAKRELPIPYTQVTDDSTIDHRYPSLTEPICRIFSYIASVSRRSILLIGAEHEMLEVDTGFQLII